MCVCVCVWVCEGERESVCVCVCVCFRGVCWCIVCLIRLHVTDVCGCVAYVFVLCIELSYCSMEFDGNDMQSLYITVRRGAGGGGGGGGGGEGGRGENMGK